MGTSNPFGGGNNGNPLIPGWVGGGDGPDGPPDAPPGAPDGDNPEAPAGGDAPEPNRFQSARTNFFKFAKAGGGVGGGADGGRGGNSSRSMRRAIGRFVGKSSGGARQAAHRMASERQATANLGRILSSAGATSIQETVRRLGYAQLATLPVPDIYAALVDVICQPGGELDESFAREAYIKALAEISATNADLERPSPETTVSFLASFIANAIQNRLLNAVGNKVVSVPLDVAAVQNVEQQINDYIRGEVDDAMREAGEDFPVGLIVETIDDIYERSCELLEDFHDQEPDADDGAAPEAEEEAA
ncbi:MAG: hypothetical protein K2W78_12875 [Xanthobacteraceae bacterium]|nr:hypothetical protein [Xanthobacteraceae bacterium]